VEQDVSVGNAELRPLADRQNRSVLRVLRADVKNHAIGLEQVRLAERLLGLLRRMAGHGLNLEKLAGLKRAWGLAPWSPAPRRMTRIE
jgi:hypothetical protein